MPLGLNPDPDSGSGQGQDKTAPPPTNPVIGWFAVGFGLLGIFTISYIFVPLSLICSVVALFMRQISWAFIGLLLSVVGFLTSPVLLTLLGIGWIASYF